ncbi:uncharacterized protein LOC143288226 [Babylonia areolata]|uniref:uncharacterized protein LOC143288226 n=1 Tax=Babylonia areolata TaxID=304850 RepID=UPI003FD3A82B
MAGRTETGEADGEWSDASEDAVKSGSATDASKTEGEDGTARQLGSRPSLRTLTHPSCRSSRSSPSCSSSPLGRKDPVHSVLDKIDAELAAMSSSSASASTSAAAAAAAGGSKGPKSSLRTSTTYRPRSSLPPLLTKYSTSPLFSDSKDHRRPTASGTASEQEQQRISGSAEIYTDATLTDDEARATQTTEDFLSDLDSVVVQQIDSRFKEIMLQKKGTTAPPTSLSTFPQQQEPPPPPLQPPILTLTPPTPFAAYLDAPPPPQHFPLPLPAPPLRTYANT